MALTVVIFSFLFCFFFLVSLSNTNLPHGASAEGDRRERQIEPDRTGASITAVSKGPVAYISDSVSSSFTPNPHTLSVAKMKGFCYLPFDGEDYLNRSGKNGDKLPIGYLSCPLSP